MTHIALIGLPGSGKTTIGRQLARRLGLPFVDTDEAIEQELGCSIRDFFEAEGEVAFRDVESRVLHRLTEGPPCLLSTGGGIVLRPENRQRLREACRVVYLRASANDLFRRLRHDQKRPLLQVADPLERLKALEAERGPLYRETAHFTVDAGRSHLHQVVNKLAAQIELEGGAPEP
ncbi:shikimate kinase [Ramlibacter sp. AW1]|uniref:Shikimate kinase n=1 Tax=Ramlibacter aurantiacus TaxID=2801330 RepID=A0A936ZRV3_9BURK|nr:shikimate kinase [Ramlibacter aurantiacus]MBL0422328.1 shikimate kinase [Ramlibacter aurantiacus]